MQLLSSQNEQKKSLSYEVFLHRLLEVLVHVKFVIRCAVRFSNPGHGRHITVCVRLFLLKWTAE